MYIMQTEAITKQIFATNSSEEENLDASRKAWETDYIYVGFG
jgi:hypothetical protein